ncbi:hypothetical protein [Massilia sp. YMA4]|uniref:Uncharacterized protein n=1 Tax=[Empedobacter] haloabium TaxID=592317 RepID=A0ABZ1URK0_9BURK|nr:hypothetical protein [Massilia sp. YMA4]AXA91392.1 hypothetical protein DPH57_09640 [Massilia sp. YMA4]
MIDFTISTPTEADAVIALRDALQKISRAQEVCERAGFGCLVLMPLSESQRELQYALDTALGRN